MNDKDAEQMELDLGLNKETFTLDIGNFSEDGSVYNDSSIYAGGHTITLDANVLDTGDYAFADSITPSFEEWVDRMPSMSKIKGMCEQYPAFQKEFEKFKQMYNLIKDDYEANNEDDIPF